MEKTDSIELPNNSGRVDIRVLSTGPDEPVHYDLLSQVAQVVIDLVNEAAPQLIADPTGLRGSKARSRVTAKDHELPFDDFVITVQTLVQMDNHSAKATAQGGLDMLISDELRQRGGRLQQEYGLGLVLAPIVGGFDEPYDNDEPPGDWFDEGEAGL